MDDNEQRTFHSGTDASVSLLGSVADKPVRTIISDTWNLLTKDWWLWELIAATLAAVAVSAIAVVLVLVDDSPRPDWPHFVTVNSIISLFATVAKLAISCVVGSAINQYKWLWYGKEAAKPVKDLQSFDDASRGPVGAAILLVYRGARSIVAIGCLLVISNLLFDPFLQQVVVYPDRAVPASQPASVSRSQRYVAHEDEGLPLPSVVDLSMKGAIYNGVFAIKDKPAMSVDHDCSTGNCSYPTFSSLAICNTCVNITEYVKKSCDQTGCYELRLPGGISLSGLGGQINASMSKISPDLRSIEASIVQIGILTSKSVAEPDDARAFECAFYYCINQYRTFVSGSVFKQSVQRSWRNDSARLNSSQDLLYRPPSSFLSHDDDPKEYRVSALAAGSLGVFMRHTFTGSGGLNKSGSAFSSDMMQALHKQSNLTARMDNLAVSMTNNLREHNDSKYDAILGVAWHSEAYVHVRWGWFSFPAAVTCLALLFLVASMIETSRKDAPVWKSSNLALLLHGRSLSFKSSPRGHVGTISRIDEAVADMDVRLLQDSEKTWRLVETQTGNVRQEADLRY